MELLFLDENFQLASHPIDRYYSLQWVENYYDEGTFELHLAADLFPTVMRSEYVYNNEADEAMLIDDVQASDDGKQTLKLSGKSLDTLLRHRVMDQVDSFTGTVEDIARQAVQKYAIASDRSVSLLRLGVRKGYTDTAVATNERGAELYEWLRELFKPYEMSFRIHYNFEANALDFEVYRGLDRTQEQTTNTWAIFSTSFENLSQFSYARNRSDYRNYAIVMTDDGTKRVTVDKTGGAPRRELFVSADDELDTAAMTQLGESALAEYAMIETVSGEVQGGANMIYGENYALGDLCNIEDTHLGVSAAARLTQMTTVVEKGVTRRVPSFGEQYLSLRQYVAREVRASGGGGSSGGGVVDLTGIEQAIAANAAAIEDNADEIAGLDARVAKLESSKWGELPDGYTELVYIQSSGTQYINTLYKPTSSNLRIQAVFAIMEIQSWRALFGGEATGSGPWSPTLLMNSSSSLVFFCGTSGSLGGIPVTAKQTYTLDCQTDNGMLSYDISGVSGSVPFTGTIDKTMDICLFVLNSTSTSAFTDQITKLQLYKFKIFDHGVLVRDYVPCINDVGEYGLYDKAHGLFYGNAGTGSFTGG